MKMNTYALMPLFISMTILTACEDPISCVPEEVTRATADQGQLTLARRVAAVGSDNAPVQAKNPQVRVYLDVSFSLRGFITGATCGDCVSPGGKSTSKTDAQPNTPFYDPLFATLISNLTNLPLRSLPDAPIRYHVFAEKFSEVEQDVYGKIGKDYNCYDQNDEKNKKIIDRNEYSLFKNKCFFDDEKLELSKKKVGSRDVSPLKNIFNDIESALEETKNPIDEGLFVIATDLFIAKNQDVIGPNAAVVAPLAKLIKKGFQVRLFGFQLPFSGRVDDVPTSSFRVKGLVPFYYLAIGTPSAVERFSRQVVAVSEQIQFTPGIDQPKRVLAGSERFNAYAIGGGGSSATPSFSPGYDFPPESTAATPPVVVSSVVDVDRVLSASGGPVKLTWRRPKSATVRPPIQAANYRVNILGWRWTRQATDGDACPVSWEIVPSSLFNPSPLSTADAETLTMDLFGGGGLNVESGIPYVLRLSLTSNGNQGGFGWIDAWSSDANTINDDVEAAKSPGAFIRTYNLSTLFRSLSAATPSTTYAPTPPLASSVLAVRYH